MKMKLWTILDKVSGVYMPVFEMRNIKQIINEITEMCSKTGRKPEEYVAYELGIVSREDHEEETGRIAKTSDGSTIKEVNIRTRFGISIHNEFGIYDFSEKEVSDG